MARRYTFTEQGAKRIVKAVREQERSPEGSPFQAYNRTFEKPLPGPVPFLVDLVQVSGSAGSGTTTCSFVYDMFRFGSASGIELGTSLSPLRDRDQYTQYLPATIGFGYQALDGSLQLLEAFEQVATELCEE